MVATRMFNTRAVGFITACGTPNNAMAARYPDPPACPTEAYSIDTAAINRVSHRIVMAGHRSRAYNSRARIMPTRTAICPSTTLPTVFARARKKDRSWMSEKVSKLNVEKVVYPPRNPIAKKGCQSGN